MYSPTRGPDLRSAGVTADRIDLASGTLVFESLKKRKKGVYRAVPLPPALLDALDLVHGIRERQKGKETGRKTRLWTWSQPTAWRHVKAAMEAAGIADATHASPKGLHASPPSARASH